MKDTSAPATFEALSLDEHLLRAVQAAGFTTPTPVQQAAIPAVLEGRDVLARAHTGSGKTAAFGLPLLQRLCGQERGSGTRGNYAPVLILTPTRELAMQVGDTLGAFAQNLPVRLKVLAVHGGVGINPQMMALRGGVDVLVATPGRLLDLQRHNAVNLERTRVLVLDEADRMLSLGFADELAEIFSFLPGRRQTLLFSATFPEALQQVIDSTLHHPLRIDLGQEPEPQIEQHVYTVEQSRKSALLVHLLKTRDLRQVLVFVSMKRTGDALAGKLARAGIGAALFHGDKAQGSRTRSLSDFRSGRLRVLIATDLGSRGLDIEDLPVVINYELPRSPNDYVHRIGRTGRAGRTGLAISLICEAESQHFGVIEKRMKMKLPREQVPGFA